MRRASIVLVLAAAAGVLAVPREGAAARWYEDYERAVELIASGECSREAIQLLGAAVVERPKPRQKARTIAVKVIDYFPYYQLARAHLACGEIDAARDYLSQSRDRDVAPADLLDELEGRLQKARTVQSPSAGPEVDTEELGRLAGDAQAVIRQAIAAQERIASQRRTPWLADFFDANRARLDDAARNLGEAQNRLNEGTLNRDRTAIEDAERSASEALAALEGLERAIAGVPTPRPTATAAARRPAQQTVATPVPSPATGAAASRPAAVATPRPEPTPGRGATGSRPAVPDSLRLAATRYLTGAYDDVVRDLDPARYSSPAQKAAAHLLRGAAHFAVYCLDGRGDADRLERARSDVARTLQLDPSLRPDPRFFSPEYAALFP